MDKAVDTSIEPVRDRDGRVRDIRFRFAYRFDTAGRVTGIRVGDTAMPRLSSESLADLRRRGLDQRLSANVPLVREFFDGLGPSRGLPGNYSDEDKRRAEHIRAAVRDGARRRRREKEWGERVLSVAAISMAID